MPDIHGFLKNATVRQSRRIAERWVRECESRGDLSQHPPILYQAYVCDGGDAFESTMCRGVSEYFEGSAHSDPRLAQTREALVRLMAIVSKAHFFLFKNDFIQEEPSVFWVPDLVKANKNRFGIYCPFMKSKKAMVAAQADLALVSSARLSLVKFPVVLTSEHGAWLDEKHWESLAREGDALRLINEAASVPEARGARESLDVENFPYGHLFDVPSELRQHMKQAGLRSADALGKMYLPKGFDLPPVQAYFDHLMGEYTRAKALSGFVKSEF